MSRLIYIYSIFVLASCQNSSSVKEQHVSKGIDCSEVTNINDYVDFHGFELKLELKDSMVSSISEVDVTVVLSNPQSDTLQTILSLPHYGGGLYVSYNFDLRDARDSSRLIVGNNSRLLSVRFANYCDMEPHLIKLSPGKEYRETFKLQRLVMANYASKEIPPGKYRLQLSNSFIKSNWVSFQIKG
ncbi:MAG: hypothetical protein ACFHU9_06750 [Fluviicola sp.]